MWERAAGVSLRGFGVSWRIDVGCCAVSDVESRQIAAREMRCVIIGSSVGNVRTREHGRARVHRQYVRGAPRWLSAGGGD